MSDCHPGAYVVPVEFGEEDGIFGEGIGFAFFEDEVFEFAVDCGFGSWNYAVVFIDVCHDNIDDGGQRGWKVDDHGIMSITVHSDYHGQGGRWSWTFTDENILRVQKDLSRRN